MSSAPYDVLNRIKSALEASGSFQYIGYFPFDVKKAIANAQNTQTTNYATAIIEDGSEEESQQIALNGYDCIDYYISIYFYISRNKGTSVKQLHDYETIIKTVMTTKATYTGLTGAIVTYFNSTEKGNYTTAELGEDNMIGYSDGMIGRKINYRINMQVARAGTC